MASNVVQAEARSESAKVCLRTYRYDSPSEQVRSPTQHVLTLFTSQPSSDWRGFFRNPCGAGRMFQFGDLIFVPAGTSIFGAGPGGDKKMITCTFERGGSSPLRNVEGEWSDRDLVRCGDIRSPRLIESMRRLGQEVAEPGFGSDVVIDALTMAVQVDLIRYFRDQSGRAFAPAGGLSARQLRIVEDFVQAWPGRAVKVAELAALAGVSRGHFMRAFKQSTGKTVHGFIEEVRLGHAKRMLAERALPLKQIAAELGFTNPSSFSLAFRRATSITPACYREIAAG